MVKGSQPKMGSTVVRGEVEATVAYTGINTFFGKTADLLNVKKGLDHLQKTLLTIVAVLTILSIVLCLTCFIYIWVRCAGFYDLLRSTPSNDTLCSVANVRSTPNGTPSARLLMVHLLMVHLLMVHLLMVHLLHTDFSQGVPASSCHLALHATRFRSRP
jgi:hypothetical protein